MSEQAIPENLRSLHGREEGLRARALELVAADARLALHVRVVENAMDMADLLRQVPTEDEDMKVIQVLGMRTFNAFGASLKLALSGYSQNGALILRDILETVFLLNLFRGDRTLIERWRFGEEMAEAKRLHEASGESERVFAELRYRTRDTWSCERRVVAKAEHMSGGENPRFIVTSYAVEQWAGRELYEQGYCARGEMENRIKGAPGELVTA